MTLLFGVLGFLVYGPQLLVAVAAADFAAKAASSSAVGLTGFFGYMGASACGIGTGMLVD
jgi:sugar phosphate permease